MRGLFRRLAGLVRGRRAHAAWLTDSVVLAIGLPVRDAATEMRARATLGGKAVRLYSWDRDIGDGRGPRARIVGIEQLLEEELPQVPEARHAVPAALARAAAEDLGGPGAPRVASCLRSLRDALRTDLPELTTEPGSPLVVNIDAIGAVDDRSFWAFGWVHDTHGVVDTLEVVSPEGLRADLLDGSCRYRRPDVEEAHAEAGAYGQRHGFVRFFELAAPSQAGPGWTIELRDTAGTRHAVRAPMVSDDPLGLRLSIVHEVAIDRPESELLRAEHAHPAMERLQARLRKQVNVEAVLEYGEQPEDPAVSIVVPLYKRIDLLEHQLAHFKRDPEIARADLIYVLDSPELAQPLARLAPSLHEIYGTPFRVARLSRNSGYSAANNIGTSLARGGTLLLLNSDVMPSEPGWLGRMLTFHQATEGIGALAPKLLFEDDSIQHAGMYFERMIESGLWGNRHYFKGFTRNLAPAQVSRPVPAVTGACLMIGRALYERVGGLSDAYVEGGFEDSDLCLRLAEAGRTNWYFADVELYHLEAQSYRYEARPANIYNAWLHTRLWGAQIEDMMRAQALTSDSELLLVDRA